MKKKIYINISFDDLHPEDGRGNIGDNVMTALLALKNEFKDIKYTFFTTPNFCHGYKEPTLLKIIKRRLHLLGLKKDFLAFRKHEKGEDFFNIVKHKEWCEFIRRNIDNNFFEICIHGYNHYAKYLVPSAEFLNISSNENIKKIKDAEMLFKQRNIKFTKAFRSPGWGVNKDLDPNLFDLGYSYISLNPNLCRLEYDKKRNIFYIPQNYSIEKSKFDGVIEFLKNNNMLFIKGHLYEKLENGIRDDTVSNLANLLNLLKGKFDIEFIFIRDINNLYLNYKLEKIYEV